MLAWTQTSARGGGCAQPEAHAEACLSMENACTVHGRQSRGGRKEALPRPGLDPFASGMPRAAGPAPGCTEGHGPPRPSRRWSGTMCSSSGVLTTLWTLRGGRGCARRRCLLRMGAGRVRRLAHAWSWATSRACGGRDRLGKAVEQPPSFARACSRQEPRVPALVVAQATAPPEGHGAGRSPGGCWAALPRHAHVPQSQAAVRSLSRRMCVRPRTPFFLGQDA